MNDKEAADKYRELMALREMRSSRKDKTTSIRINSKVLERLKEEGLSPQKIVDQAVLKSYAVWSRNDNRN